jgi:hypothetical protein
MTMVKLQQKTAWVTKTHRQKRTDFLPVGSPPAKMVYAGDARLRERGGGA